MKEITEKQFNKVLCVLYAILSVLGVLFFMYSPNIEIGFMTTWCIIIFLSTTNKQ